jgi:hypothetical protein
MHDGIASEYRAFLSALQRDPHCRQSCSIDAVAGGPGKMVYCLAMPQEWWTKIRPTKIERVTTDSEPEYEFDLFVNSAGLSWRSRYEGVEIPWSSVTSMNFKVDGPRDRDSYRSLGWVMGPGSPLFFAIIRKVELRRSASTLVVRHGESHSSVRLKVNRRSDILRKALKPAFNQSRRPAETE